MSDATPHTPLEQLPATPASSKRARAAEASPESAASAASAGGKQRAASPEDNEDLDACETASEDSDDAGSLVAFVVKDAEEPPPERVEESSARGDMDGIAPKNIVPGTRRRTPTQRYAQEVFSSAEYQKMALDDVPDDEMDAALGHDEDESKDESDEEAGAHN